jgi:NAD(P)H-hydrate epimerase
VEEYRIPIVVLMENAGRAVAEAAVKLLHKPAKGMLILAGPGNNGGDALVAARHLHNAGARVTILLLAKREEYRDAAGAQLAIVEAMKLRTETISADHSEVRDWVVDSDPGDVIVDGLFGTGLSRAVEGLAAEVIRAANGAKRTIVAIDIPSGLDAESGEPLGVAIRATETVSFCGLKRGFARGKEFTGKVTVADIGAPRELLAALAQK